MVLGRPQFLPSRPGLPIVVTYLVEISDDPFESEHAIRMRELVRSRDTEYPQRSPEPEREIQVARATLAEHATLSANQLAVRPTARFAIPTPPMGEELLPLRSSWPAGAVRADLALVPRPDLPSGDTASSGRIGPDGTAPGTDGPKSRPSVLGNDDGLRADVEALLRGDRRAHRLWYRLDSGELILSGKVANPGDLYDLTAKLGDLPGVELVSFEDLKITQ